MILTVTLNPAIDKSTRVSGIVPDKKLRCETPKYEPGGGGINVSRAIMQLGGHARTLYLSGGHTGVFFGELLGREGLTDLLPVEISGLTRESFIVVDSQNGQQFRFGMDGPEVSEEEFRACLSAIEKQGTVEYLVGSGSLPPGLGTDAYARMARLARPQQARFILDTSGEALRAAADEGVYLLKPNLNELSQLVGEKELDFEYVDEAGLELIRKGFCEVVAVSLGPQGAMLVTQDGYAHIAAPAVKVRSTVGAGDSMVAGMTLALSRNWPLEKVVQYGVAAGSAATLNEGTDLCQRPDVERLLKHMQRARQPLFQPHQ